MTSQTPAGTSTGGAGTSVVRRPCTLPAAAAGLGERLAHRPAHRVRRARPPARRPGRCRRRSRPRPARPRAPPAGGRRPPAPPGGMRRPGPGRSPATGALDPPVRQVPGVEDRAPPGAAAQVGEQRLADRPWSARSAMPAPVGGAGPRRCSRPQCLEPHDDARGTEPALAGPARPGTRRPRPARSASGRPSSVVTTRPATRRSGVTQATRGWPSTSTVQQPHWPWGLQPSFTERAPRRSRRASASEQPSSSTATARPSTVSETTVTGDATSPPGEDRFPR